MPLGSLVTWRKKLHFLQVLQKTYIIISNMKSQAVFNRLNTGFKLGVEDHGNFWKASSVHLFHLTWALGCEGTHWSCWLQLSQSSDCMQWRSDMAFSLWLRHHAMELPVESDCGTLNRLGFFSFSHCVWLWMKVNPFLKGWWQRLRKSSLQCWWGALWCWNPVRPTGISRTSWNDGETVWSLRQVTPICAYLLAEAIHEAEWKHLNILEQGITFFKVDSNTEATVDGQNPAPPRMMIIPLFLGF